MKTSHLSRRLRQQLALVVRVGSGITLVCVAVSLLLVSIRRILRRTRTSRAGFFFQARVMRAAGSLLLRNHTILDFRILAVLRIRTATIPTCTRVRIRIRVQVRVHPSSFHVLLLQRLDASRLCLLLRFQPCEKALSVASSRTRRCRRNTVHRPVLRCKTRRLRCSITATTRGFSSPHEARE